MNDLRSYIQQADAEIKVTIFCAVMMGLSVLYKNIDPIFGAIALKISSITLIISIIAALCRLLMSNTFMWIIIILPLYCAALSHAFNEIWYFKVFSTITVVIVAIEAFWYIFFPRKKHVNDDNDINVKYPIYKKFTGGILFIVLAIFGIVEFIMFPNIFEKNISLSDDNKKQMQVIHVEENTSSQGSIEKINEQLLDKYIKFSDSRYGFSFEYPKELPKLRQQDCSKNPYKIKVDDNCVGKIKVDILNDKNIDVDKDIENAYTAFMNVKAKKISNNEYEFSYISDKTNHVRKVFLINFNGSLQRQYIDFELKEHLDEETVKVVEHIMNSFKPINI